MCVICERVVALKNCVRSALKNMLDLSPVKISQRCVSSKVNNKFVSLYLSTSSFVSGWS